MFNDDLKAAVYGSADVMAEKHTALGNLRDGYHFLLANGIVMSIQQGTTGIHGNGDTAEVWAWDQNDKPVMGDPRGHCDADQIAMIANFLNGAR